jgi:hypothetical protein
VYLSDLTDQSGKAVAGPISLNGTSYPHSIEYGDAQVGEGLEQDGSVVSFVYAISAAHYRVFDATVGFLSYNTDPVAVGLFTVKVDNSSIKTVPCTRYAACAIHADLPAGSQLTLDMQLTSWTDVNHTRYFPAAYPAWGDARLSA